ncbi:putative RNA binding protein YcfA (HicA-like mRNA interferase family) [Kribbella amoyensis]|uniref:Putative RNA binding protein YcfA (HicA-like mRNA interferase family) n=1 Tax=Kribbella amoyensis TaxID=996641 RepID=A0A561B9D7_9ACTN|nr:type II toxin-antitoxin system HicA family toxin [Kribbella amoyensis]TWD75322.1 putative RNA binding protein YcfA (HicA-like mRNA interferase family) [Kribbella amoyensis]
MTPPKKRKDAEKELKDAGFSKLKDRGKGSHEVWQDEKGTSVTVPNHGKEINGNTWKSIQRQSGMGKGADDQLVLGSGNEQEVDHAMRLASDGIPRAGSGQGRGGSGEQSRQHGGPSSRGQGQGLGG